MGIISHANQLGGSNPNVINTIQRTERMNKRLKYLLAFTATLLINIPFLSHAQMAINNSIIHFGTGHKDRSDIEVTNTSTDPLYLRVTAFEITNPGTAEQARVKITDPKEAGLLVSPNKMVISPKGSKLVRFVNLNKNRGKEKVFRVTFEPVSGDIKGDQTGLKLLIGYEVLVLAQPTEIASKLDTNRTGSELILSNSGNSNIYLRDVKQCAAENTDKKDCIKLRDKRLYPGNQWQVSLKEKWPVLLEIGVDGHWTRRVIQ